MNVTFYSGFSKRRNSTKQPSGGTTKSVVLKENTSEMRPAFVVSNVDWSWNYASWGGRYYYINDIVSEGNNLFRVECALDSMATFKSQIGAYSTLISRSDASFSGEVVDTIYPAKTNPYTLSASASTAGLFTTDRSSGAVVMGIVGGSGLKFFIMSRSQFDNLCATLFPAFTQSPVDWFNAKVSEALVGGLNTIMDAIVLLKWIPVDVSLAQAQLGLTSVSSFYIGPLQLTGVSGVYELTGNTMVTIAARQIAFPDRSYTGVSQRGDWLYMPPFAYYTLKAPPFGDIQIDGTFLIPSQLYVQATVRVEILSGNAQLWLTYYDSGFKTIGTYDQNVAYDIKAGGSSGNFAGAASGIITAAASYASENAAGVVGGIASAAASLLPKPAYTGGGVSGPKPDMNSPWYAEATYFNPVEENRAELGRPLGEVRTISTLPGYVQCALAQLSIPGHVEEMNEINTILSSGFFYE